MDENTKVSIQDKELGAAEVKIDAAPLVSVIIPCYNHAHYLPEALESVLRQTYQQVEILVVDDGSKDNTAEVAKSYPMVRYIHQHNQGLSATRNTGIRHSSGEMLVFLDADDWLYPEALEINVRYLLENKDAALVSGAYDRVFVEDNVQVEEVKEVASNHYWHLLHGNFIGVPASVMYRRWVFKDFLFDVTLRACEDYDLYLKVYRTFPVLHHTQKVAAYRTHSASMSSNTPLMLYSALKVLRRQKPKLTGSAEKEAYNRGKRLWTDYYCKELYQKLSMGKVSLNRASAYVLLRYRPKLMVKYLLRWQLEAGLK